ncbi:glycoside hydrolase family 15 protein [Ferroplasma acidiphilum]|uniref:Glycoside hydrolase family 15 protein n=3 Tax=Ferroplasma acidiphilum TaxID=74969 RepID=A0A7K4FPB4_9ARCH|nr:glycoside hydrolase family 15 protein [Ferroplasma acidiphilum]NOL60864.1 glycoside hydrolase family 15 protein [Ferroplasma acidiphilum]
MVRYIPLGNGKMLLTFDEDYRIVDFYFSETASGNHAAGHPFMYGVSVDDNFKWIDRNQIDSMDYYDHTMVGTVNYSSDGINFENKDFVDIYRNVYVRFITISNNSGVKKNVKLFFHQNFYIYGNDIGDTAAFYPEFNGILHYKEKRYFMASTIDQNGKSIDQYATGVKDVGNLKGTWKDAEDNELSMNPVSIGSVDSVLRHSFDIEAESKFYLYYYIIAGENYEDIEEISMDINLEYMEKLNRRTTNYWELWSSKVLPGLDSETNAIFRRSLFIVKSHSNSIGAIAASCDSDILKISHDGYYYMWPRDASIAAYALSIAGHTESGRKFFSMSTSLMSGKGYMYHKYNMDGSPASSWLPHIMNGKEIYPIQEDETALLIYVLWEYFKKYNDIGFTAPFYESIVIRAAEFMTEFVDADGLPRESFDLWEERYGIHAYTVSTTFAALKAAANFAGVFGDQALARKYSDAADRMVNAFDRKFYSDEYRRYARAIINGKLDFTVDSALSSIAIFGMKAPTDSRVLSTMEAIMEKLWVNGSGGIARYENDNYMRIRDDSNITGNPWIITTLWMARYYIRIGNLEKSWSLIEWVKSHRQKSGIFSEQINPYTGEPHSVSPLVWSNAEFIIAILEYSSAYRNQKD